MELIERYLQAVEFWLPKQQKHDIIAELSEDIHAQMDEREAELGRTLNQAEVEALLKQRGAPMLVANRYLPQEHLIGPLLFPIYSFVLKIVALCYLVPWVLVWIGLTIYGPVNPAGPGTHSWSATFGALWGSFWLTAFVSLGIVTLVFAVLERVHARTRFLENWNALRLPPVRDLNRIPRSSSVIELVVNLVFYSWWASAMSSPIVLQRPEVRIVLSPLWSYFYWSFMLLALANAALAATNLLRPYNTKTRASLRLLSDFAGSALFCWLLRSNILVTFMVTNAQAARSVEIANTMNSWMARMFPVAIVACAVIVAVDVYRIARVKSRIAPLGRATSMTTV